MRLRGIIGDMDKKSTFVIVGIIILAVIVFVIVAVQKRGLSELDGSPVATTTAWEDAPAEPPALPISEKTVVTAKHAYRDGAHIIAGEVPLPTPCHLLEASTVVTADKKSVAVQLVSSVKTDEICAQVITPARFRVTARADRNAVFTGTLNGQEIKLNLIEAGPNEDLENFDLYIKG